MLAPSLLSLLLSSLLLTSHAFTASPLRPFGLTNRGVKGPGSEGTKLRAGGDGPLRVIITGEEGRRGKSWGNSSCEIREAGIPTTPLVAVVLF